MKPNKFFCRLIVGMALVILAGLMIWRIITTIAFPSLPLKKGAESVQDISESMSQPDKNYAENAIVKATKENKITIVLDYELKTFDITDSYIEKTVGNVTNSVYKIQPYIVYTYFKDTKKLIVTTNINDTSADIVNNKKENIDNDARIVKEILYYQQNLSRKHGIKNWNFNLTPTYMRNTLAYAVGSIILLILGFGVIPSTKEGLKNPFRRKRKKIQEG